MARDTSLGECSVDGCTRQAKYKRTGWCQTHYHRWWRNGDHQMVRAPERTDFEDLTYRHAHARIVELWGHASKYRCVLCGESAANEWAYDGTDPTAKTQIFEGRYPVRFSVYPEYYFPACHGCHRLKDAGERAARRTHCRNGHEMTAENTYTRPSRPGTRECLTCKHNDYINRQMRKRTILK